MSTIFFNSKSRKWAFLSNFYPAPFELDGKTYPTVEHYYQSQKTFNLVCQEMIRKAPSPANARRLGRKCPLRPDWEKIKVEVMEKAVRAKFAQNPHLRRKLLATGNAELVELSPWDKFWGTDRYGNGLNKLGKILMKIREEFRKSEEKNAMKERKPTKGGSAWW